MPSQALAQKALAPVRDTAPPDAAPLRDPNNRAKINFRPETDSSGRAIPFQIRVTICAGSSWELTGIVKEFGPANIRNTSSSNTKIANAAEFGEAKGGGVSVVPSGGKGVPAATGSALVEFDVVDKESSRSQHVKIRVNVVECKTPRPAGGNGGGGAVREKPRVPVVEAPPRPASSGIGIDFGIGIGIGGGGSRERHLDAHRKPCPPGSELCR